METLSPQKKLIPEIKSFKRDALVTKYISALALLGLIYSFYTETVTTLNEKRRAQEQRLLLESAPDPSLNIDPDLQVATRQLRLEYPYFPDGICSGTLLKTQLYDHDKNPDTPSTGLAVVLGVEHCFTGIIESISLNTLSGERVTGEKLEIHPIGNTDDPPVLALINFPSINPLLSLKRSFVLAPHDQTLGTQRLQTCGYPVALNGHKLCQTGYSLLSKRGELLLNSTPLNPGNSGGAVLNEHGEIIGVVSQAFNSHKYPDAVLVSPITEEVNIEDLIFSYINAGNNYLHSETSPRP